MPVSVRRFLARPASESLAGAASVPSGTLLTVPSRLQASEQTGLDALRRIPGDPPSASRAGHASFLELVPSDGWVAEPARLLRATALGFRRHSLSPAGGEGSTRRVPAVPGWRRGAPPCTAAEPNESRHAAAEHAAAADRAAARLVARSY